VLENPQTGAIEAFYGGPGYPGARYDGYGRRISVRECNVIHCQENMAIYAREQVGSSFKPYVLAAAVANGMNAQDSWLDGQDFVCIPPDSSLYPGNLTIKNDFPDPTTYPNCQPGWYHMTNDSTTENGAFNPQDAMTNSVNTAYADLWHYVGGASVLHMADVFGVRTDSILSGGSGLDGMQHEAGVALGQASLSVLEQATMLSAIDNGGTYHAAHVIGSISQGSAHYRLNVASHPVFSQDPLDNSHMASQVQYAMSQVAYNGTGAAAGMSDARPIIAKTGTTNTAQSAFFIGAIPQESLAVGIFTNHQSQTLNGLGGISQGFGGTWPAMIWHTYAENMFLPLPPQQFPTPVFTGTPWKLVPDSMLKKPAPHKKHHPVGEPPPPFPFPTNFPTYTPSGFPTLPPFGGGQAVNATAAGFAVGGGLVALPAVCLWVRRRTNRRGTRQGSRRG
jgi:membrane peptidoglycan carboxypeptidase